MFFYPEGIFLPFSEIISKIKNSSDIYFQTNKIINRIYGRTGTKKEAIKIFIHIL